MTKITYVNGDILIKWGFTPGKWFGEAIKAADKMASANHFGKQSYTEDEIIACVKRYVPAKVTINELQDPGSVPYHVNIEAHTEYEKANLAGVNRDLNEIARVPIVRALAIMPDACPQGGGGIPVGTVAYAENAIVPGWHSADICCSVAITVFDSGTDAKAILDAGMQISHFGKGGRPHSNDMIPSQDLLNAFESNRYLRSTSGAATKHYGTQGDGNHFFYVGRNQSSGQVCLVTHHGSRKPGAILYSNGIQAAQEQSAEANPLVHKNNLWLSYDTEEGQEYWEALQLIRRWTKGNHFTIHDAVAKAVGARAKDRFWNEHNFVFKREHGGRTYFAHAKGATPMYGGFAGDNLGKALIPLNMAEPILVTRVNNDYDHGLDFVNNPSLGFAPHGAGRNLSRTDFGRLIEGKAKELIASVTDKYDVRAFSGKHDISEFPAAYKNAPQIIEQIKQFNLTEVIDLIDPIGCIMAGHDGTDWRAIKRLKKEKREREAAKN